MDDAYIKHCLERLGDFLPAEWHPKYDYENRIIKWTHDDKIITLDISDDIKSAHAVMLLLRYIDTLDQYDLTYKIGTWNWGLGCDENPYYCEIHGRKGKFLGLGISIGHAACESLASYLSAPNPSA
jgi:hypothetical protein